MGVRAGQLGKTTLILVGYLMRCGCRSFVLLWSGIRIQIVDEIEAVGDRPGFPFQKVFV